MTLGVTFNDFSLESAGGHFSVVSERDSEYCIGFGCCLIRCEIIAMPYKSVVVSLSWRESSYSFNVMLNLPQASVVICKST